MMGACRKYRACTFLGTVCPVNSTLLARRSLEQFCTCLTAAEMVGEANRESVMRFCWLFYCFILWQAGAPCFRSAQVFFVYNYFLAGTRASCRRRKNVCCVSGWLRRPSGFLFRAPRNCQEPGSLLLLFIEKAIVLCTLPFVCVF